MSCKPVCKLCPNLVISQAVTFTGGNLEINLPAGSYNDCEKYCIVVAQAIPDTTTINAPVYITIGTGTTLYPLTKRNCAQVTAWRHPHPYAVFDLCFHVCDRRLVPDARQSLLRTQQQPDQH